MGVEIPSQDEYQGLKLRDLKIDQAYVNVVRSTESIANNEQLYLYTREENCYGCPFEYFDDFLRAKVRLFRNIAFTKEKLDQSLMSIYIDFYVLHFRRMKRMKLLYFQLTMLGTSAYVIITTCLWFPNLKQTRKNVIKQYFLI